ncbi:MAG: GYF domain-containing protein [Opitutales bacterium]
MPEYYIRTPEHEESRGPFDAAKLRTLVEAGQVSENTLYYDETKEEWLPIALNEELRAELFPEKKSLKLRIGADNKTASDAKEPEDKSDINVEDMLKAAEGDTKETRHLKQSQRSFEKAVSLASNALGLIMLLSAIAFLVPHHAVVQNAVSEGEFTRLLNSPFLLVGVFDLIMAVLLLLSVTEIYPLIRARSMLGLGFGLYLGWALGDPLLMLAFTLGGVGIFLATIAQRLSTMILAIALGLFGNGALAYLAVNGRFEGFYTSIQLNLFT